jgi:hypothetical protein
MHEFLCKQSRRVSTKDVCSIYHSSQGMRSLSFWFIFPLGTLRLIWQYWTIAKYSRRSTVHILYLIQNKFLDLNKSECCISGIKSVPCDSACIIGLDVHLQQMQIHRYKTSPSTDITKHRIRYSLICISLNAQYIGKVINILMKSVLYITYHSFVR